MSDLVVALDIGNTNVHIGLADEKNLKKTWVIPLHRDNPVKKLNRILKGKTIIAGVIASVVPGMTEKFSSGLKKIGIKPFIINFRMVKNLTIKYYRPANLGIDRIANVKGGLSLYKRNIIVIDAGTATTVDVALKNRTYLGGLILPGISSSVDYLHQKTALLPRVELKKPGHIIGRSTISGIQAGIYYSITESIRGIVHRIKRELNKQFFCIATGGWGRLIHRWIDEIELFEPGLSLRGILKIYFENVKK